MGYIIFTLKCAVSWVSHGTTTLGNDIYLGTPYIKFFYPTHNRNLYSREEVGQRKWRY